MRAIFSSLLLLLCGCELQIGDSPPVAVEGIRGPDSSLCPWKNLPPVEIPQAFRDANYGGGSCMWASFCTTLRIEGQNAAADWVRHNYSGAAGIEDCARVADGLGLDYAYTNQGDTDFLEWCSRTRRPAAIHWAGGSHAVTFCGYNALGEAVLIDNNHTERYERISKAAFLAEWRNSGGRAITCVYWSPPRRPWYVPTQEGVFP